MSIDVGFDELDVATTVVMLKAQVAAGVRETPLAVELCPPGLDGPGWRRAAEEYLTEAYAKRQQGGDKRIGHLYRKRDDVSYEEMAEEMLYRDRQRLN